MSGDIKKLPYEVTGKELFKGLIHSGICASIVFALFFAPNLYLMNYLLNSGFTTNFIQSRGGIAHSFGILLIAPAFVLWIAPFFIIPNLLVFGTIAFRIMEKYKFRKKKHYIIGGIVGGLLYCIIAFFFFLIDQFFPNPLSHFLTRAMAYASLVAGGPLMTIIISVSSTYFFWKKVIKPRALQTAH